MPKVAVTQEGPEQGHVDQGNHGQPGQPLAAKADRLIEGRTKNHGPKGPKHQLRGSESPHTQ